MTKDKWINIRCTEEQRQDVTEFAKECNMAVSEFFWYLVAKERKLIEPYVPATSSSEKWFNAMLEQAKNDKIEAERILAKERKEKSNG